MPEEGLLAQFNGFLSDPRVLSSSRGLPTAVVSVFPRLIAVTPNQHGRRCGFTELTYTRPVLVLEMHVLSLRFRVLPRLVILLDCDGRLGGFTLASLRPSGGEQARICFKAADFHLYETVHRSFGNAPIGLTKDEGRDLGNTVPHSFVRIR